MSYLQTNFQGAGIPFTDARQTKMFIDRMKQDQDQRREQSKALAEDQKRLGMIAQGFGLEKGEVDSMSRGELSGFIENNINQFNQQKQKQEQVLNLQKFMVSQQNADTNRMQAEAQAKFADANMLGMQGKAKAVEDQKVSDDNLAKFVGTQIEKAKTGDIQANQFVRQYPDAVNMFKASGSPKDIKEGFKKRLSDSQMSFGKQLSPMEAKIDEKFAVDFAEYNAPVARNNIETMLTVLRRLEASKSNEELTGTIKQFAPAVARKMMDGEAVAVQQLAEGVIQGNLRATLGAQFAQREGEMFMERGYDPKLPVKENLDKVARALRQMIDDATEHERRIDYFRKSSVTQGFGTMRGYDFANNQNIVPVGNRSSFNQFINDGTGGSGEGNTTTKMRSGNNLLSVDDLEVLDPTGELGVVVPQDANSSQ